MNNKYEDLFFEIGIEIMMIILLGFLSLCCFVVGIGLGIFMTIICTGACTIKGCWIYLFWIERREEEP